MVDQLRYFIRQIIMAEFDINDIIPDADNINLDPGPLGDKEREMVRKGIGKQVSDFLNPLLENNQLTKEELSRNPELFVSRLNDRISSIESSISTLNDRVTSVENNIQTINNTIASLDQRISQLEALI